MLFRSVDSGRFLASEGSLQSLRSPADAGINAGSRVRRPGHHLDQALLWTVEREFSPIMPTPADADAISGIPGAAGLHTGAARIIRSETDFERVQPGDVVCPITNLARSALFGIAWEFVCDAGGPLSHTAVLTTEKAIPSVLATGDAAIRIAHAAVVILCQSG